MRLVLSTLFSLGLCAAALAQERTGSMTGRVTEPNGAAVTGVTVEAKHVATGAVFKAAVSSQGAYTLSQLPAGTYEISVPIVIGPFQEPTYVSFSRKDVALLPGQTLPLNIAMQLQNNLATLGDLPVAQMQGMRARAPKTTGPAPRIDGKPDLSGLWLNQSSELPPFSLQPWAQDLRKKRLDDPSQSTRPKTLCLPSGPIQMAQDFPYEFVQGRSSMIILQDTDLPGWRQIFVDGRGHPDDWNPTWLGHSIGSWDGDTLVVDTVGFNDKGWLRNDASPYSEQLHMIERFSRPDAGHLEVEMTLEDPGAFTAPWKGKLRAILGARDEQVFEYVCESNGDIVPHLTK